MKETLKVLKERRSCRNFKPDMIKEEEHTMKGMKYRFEKYSKNNTVWPGDLKFKDVNNDGIIDESDKMAIDGNNAYFGTADGYQKFEKRLKTYLKRYGLSKCSYGVYWADR